MHGSTCVIHKQMAITCHLLLFIISDDVAADETAAGCGGVVSDDTIQKV